MFLVFSKPLNTRRKQTHLKISFSWILDSLNAFLCDGNIDDQYRKYQKIVYVGEFRVLAWQLKYMHGKYMFYTSYVLIYETLQILSSQKQAAVV